MNGQKNGLPTRRNVCLPTFFSHDLLGNGGRLLGGEGVGGVALVGTCCGTQSCTWDYVVHDQLSSKIPCQLLSGASKLYYSYWGTYGRGIPGPLCCSGPVSLAAAAIVPFL